MNHCTLDLRQLVNTVPAARLTPQQVAAKYGPRVDPNWDTEREDAFFEDLSRRPWGPFVEMSQAKLMLLRHYASEDLGAKRMSDKYIHTLASILRSFADADLAGDEVLLSQRSEEHGKPRTIRTIQTQLLEAQLLVKEVRTQGRGFVGTVFVYAPRTTFRQRKATWDDFIAACRVTEVGHVGQARTLPKTFSPEDVLY